jgi:hypothetical protein
MWVMTKWGFYSAAQDKFNGDSDALVIRARQRQDLLNLQEVIPRLTADDIIVTTDSDYKYRVCVTKSEWATALTSEINDLDYTNFKDAVKSYDKQRATTYLRVWDVLYDLQINEPRGK